MPKPVDTTADTIRAGLLAWLLPGAGHWALGRRGLAAVLFVAISGPYIFGVLVGGLKESINAQTNSWLFLAECGVGSYTIGGWMWSARLREKPNTPEFVSYYPESDVAQIYLATAGLLNILAILDAMARASSGGAPTFARETARQDQPVAPAGPPGPPAAGPAPERPPGSPSPATAPLRGEQA